VSYAELAEHKTPNNCWVALHGQVYDLTNYSKRHPGTSTIITDHCGSDATLSYNVFHHEDLLQAISEEVVGQLSYDNDNKVPHFDHVDSVTETNVGKNSTSTPPTPATPQAPPILYDGLDYYIHSSNLESYVDSGRESTADEFSVSYKFNNQTVTISKVSRHNETQANKNTESTGTRMLRPSNTRDHFGRY